MTRNHILVVEDEPVTRGRIVGHLLADGFQVSEAATAAEARRIMAQGGIQLAVLDINLPDDSGFTLTRELRSQSDAGIILVTQRQEEADRIVGLELGSDDYLIKPVNPRELAVRIRNLLRRVAGAAPKSTAEPEPITFAGWSLDPLSRQLLGPTGDEVHLTRGEFEILAVLANNSGHALTREQIVELAQGSAQEAISARSIDVLVARLRRKIESNHRVPRIILTVHGIGYRLARDKA
jgi:two-component system torCAD operon response regulator TorR